MKNKKLLMLFLATISVSAVGAVAATGCNPQENHEHSYTWQSNADGHWEECECGDKKGESADHVDVKNNETGADGKDGKCDVCDYAIKQVVTFNMLGHGTAPAAQNVDFGAKATKPVDPADDDAYVFSGWYKDALCTQSFDFDNDVINDNTVLYAKWVENTTPGESKKYAFDITLDGLANLQPLTAKGYSYYKYLVTANGRYSVSLPGGYSANCYFTTDKDEDGVNYGKGYDDDSHVYDLYKGETIYVKLSCAETLDAGAEVGVLLNGVYDEPLPAEGWLSGIYTSGSGTTFTFDRENKQMMIGSVGPYACNYIGGAFDTLTVVQEMTLGDYNAKSTFSFVRRENGTYRVSATGDSPMSEQNYVCLTKLATPADVSKFEGTYAISSGAKADGITEIIIKSDGSGSYVMDGQSIVCNNNFDAEYGFLNYGQYIITLNVEDGSAVSINVFGSSFDDYTVFTRTGEAVPEKLPLGSDTSAEFEGSTYKIRVDYGTQYWGDGYSVIKVTDHANGMYLISVNDTEYNVKIIGEGNNLKIELYNAAGTTLLDTLNKYFVDYKDLPTDATNATTMNLADFKKNFYHFKATADGWYTFNTDNENLAVYYGLSEDNPTSTWSGTLLDFTDGAVTVYLAEGTVVGVQSLYTENAPESVSLTVGTTATPRGFEETNPLEINGVGSVTVDSLNKGTPLYVKFTPSATGDYLINVSYMNYSYVNYTISYSVGGTNAGFNFETYTWVGGTSADDPNYKINVSNTNPITIVVFDNGLSDGDKYNKVTVKVTSDYKSGATEIAADEFVDGTPASGMLPKLVTKSSGNYLIKDTSGSDLVLTSDSAFTAKLNGIGIDVTESDGVYTATVNSGRNLYVEVSGTVTFTLSYAVGSEQAPIGIDLNGLTFTYTVKSGETYFVFKEAGTFYASTSKGGYFSLNGVDVFGSFTAKAGDVLVVMQYYPEAVLTVKKSLPADILGSYKYADGDTKVTVGATAVTIGEKEYALSAISGNSYTFTAADSSSVTLTVSGNTLTLDGHTLTTVDTSVFNKDQVGTYKTATGYPISLTLKADGSGTYTLLSDSFEIEVTKDGDSFKFTYSERNVTFTFNGDGNVVVVDPSMGTKTLIKEASPDESGDVYAGTFETMGGAQAPIELTLSDDLKSGTLLMDDPDDKVSVNITLTSTGNNSYTFADAEAYWTGTFTINGDTVTITVDYTSISDLALTKKA